MYTGIRGATGALLLLALSGVTAATNNDTLQTVRAFFSGLDSLTADFHQEVTDANGLRQQISDGRLWILRPGRFRWDYRTPYHQELVADGERLWSYDADLAQVTVQAMDQVFSATPAMLLGGGTPLDEVFRLEALPDDGGEQHARLIPRSDDSTVEEIHVFFRDGDLQRLAATDSFGNRTVFAFSNLQRNAAVDPGRFRFVPPAGTDIIGDSD